MKSYRERYKKLEMEVLGDLKLAIMNSNYISEYCNEKAIKLKSLIYKEIIILNGSLVMLDNEGMQYSIWTHFTLEDLILLLESI